MTVYRTFAFNAQARCSESPVIESDRQNRLESHLKVTWHGDRKNHRRAAFQMRNILAPQASATIAEALQPKATDYTVNVRSTASRSET